MVLTCFQGLSYEQKDEFIAHMKEKNDISDDKITFKKLRPQRVDTQANTMNHDVDELELTINPMSVEGMKKKLSNEPT